MTTKYESVLSEADLSEIAIKNAMKSGTPESLSRRQWEDDSDIRETFICLLRDAEQAVLAKLQPQLDAIGAGGVSGQRETKDPYRELMADQADLINVDRLQQALTKQGISTPESREELNARIGHYVNLLTLYGRFVKVVPEGYKLVPIEPTLEMKRAGYVRLAETHEIAGIIYSAMIAEAPTPDTE